MVFILSLNKQLVASILKGKTRTTLALQQIILTSGIQAVSIIVSFVYVPLMLHYLEVDRYGVWLTLISIINWFGIMDVGLGSGLRNKLTESLANKDFALAKTYISTTYALLAIIVSVGFVSFSIISLFINWPAVLNTRVISYAELYWLVAIVFTFFCIRFVLQIIGVIYMSHQRPAMNSIILAVGNILSLLIVFLLTKVQSGRNLIVLGSVVSGVPVIVYFLFSIFSYRTNFKQISPSFKHINFAYKNDLMKLGLRFFMVSITSMAIFSTSNFIILQLFNASEVVRYNIAFKLFNLPMMIYSIILSPVWSAVTDAYSKQDILWLKSTLKRMNLLSAGFIVFILIIVMASKYLYRFWLGNNIDIPFALTLGLAVYTIIWVVNAPFSTFVNGFGKLKLTTRFSLLGIATFFILVFILSRVIGNSLSIAVALSITSLIGLILQSVQVRKIINGTAEGIWIK